MEISLVYDGGGGGGLRGWCQLYIVGFIWANQNPLKIQSVIHLLTGFILFPAFRFGDFYFVFLYLWIIVVVVVMVVGWGGSWIDLLFLIHLNIWWLVFINRSLSKMIAMKKKSLHANQKGRKEGKTDGGKKRELLIINSFRLSFSCLLFMII